MTINVPVKDIVEVQHIRAPFLNDPHAAFANMELEFYTGWITFDFSSPDDGIRRDQVKCLVPLHPATASGTIVQDYPNGVAGAIVTASISSFGRTPSVAAVDAAAVQLVNGLAFPGSTRSALVLEADVAVADGHLNRIAYQVTVLAQVREPDELDRNVFAVGASQTVP
jgi:hypothetical protein